MGFRFTLMALFGLFLAAAGLSGWGGSAPAAAAEPPAAQRAEIEKIVREYLLNNPETIVEALQAYETRRHAAAAEASAAAIGPLRQELERDPAAPVAGNPKGGTTIVEFFDYRCGYCKRMVPTIQSLLKSDGDIRYVFREFPILGPESVTASKAALAVWKLAPEKYFPFHLSLMENRGALTEARVVELAQAQGIEPQRLRTAMADSAIEEHLRRTAELARKINVNGTPAFVIGGRLVPGAVELDSLKELIAAARAG